MVHKKTMYSAVVEASKEYLGPAAERFIRRQIEMHLAIKPEKLQAKDIPALVDWVKLAFAMLTDDSSHVEAFSGDLLNISSTGKINQQPTYAKNA